MARYVDISDQPAKRKNLRMIAILVLLAGIIFPLAFSMVFGQFRTLSSDSQEVPVEVHDRGTDASGKQCWEATAETQEKNVLGFSAATNNFRAQWCASDGKIIEQAGDSTYRSRMLGWDMADTETHVKDSTITVIQPLNYQFLNMGMGFDRTVEFTVTDTGQAEAVTY